MSSELLKAIKSNDIESVENLIVRDADINLKAALYYAVENGRTSIVRLLLKKGAQVDSTFDNSGVTVLHCASSNGHIEIVKMLLEHKAPINSTTPKSGATPLFYAAGSGRTKVVELLLKNGAVDLPDVNGTTTLYYVYLEAGKNYNDIAKLLIVACLSKNLQAVKPSCIENNNDLSIFFDQAQAEAKQLSNHLSDTGIHVFLNKLLYNNPIEVAESLTLGNIDTLTAKISKPEFKKTSPIFFSLLKPRLKELKPVVKERMDCLDSADECVILSSDGSSRQVALGGQALREVFKELSNEDIKKIAFFQPVPEADQNKDTLTASNSSCIARFSVP